MTASLLPYLPPALDHLAICARIHYDPLGLARYLASPECTLRSLDLDVDALTAERMVVTRAKGKLIEACRTKRIALGGNVVGMLENAVETLTLDFYATL
jgi:hypothetical protein